MSATYSTSIPVKGAVGGVTEADAARLSVVALRGNTVVATSPLRADGSYDLHLPHDAHLPHAFPLQVAVLPSIAAAYPARVGDAPRATLAAASLLGGRPAEAPVLTLEPHLIDGWSIFWHEWCVSGTILGPNGCPAPSAAVTVYTVGWGIHGYTKVPRGTVTAGPDGTFSLCFPWWNLFFCWPCEPVWWLCWPWWWERDILHVIETLETRNVRGLGAATLFRPEPRALATGQGFVQARVAPMAPDAARTALITKKLANPDLRAIFPWRWWCFSEPNIVFGATQGGTVILAEDPAIDTRWHMGSGEMVTLTGSDATKTACPGGPIPDVGTVWLGVGRFITGSEPGSGEYPLDTNGLGQAGGDSSDLAFAGTLTLNASTAANIAYYQVQGAVWSAPPFRAAGVLGAPQTIAAELWQSVWIYDPGAGYHVEHAVRMGPFTQGGVADLYATTAGRPGMPATPEMPAFPPNPLGLPPIWGERNRVLYADATALLAHAPFGAVDLSLVGYDASLTVVTASPPPTMRVMVDATPLGTGRINTLTAYTDAARTTLAPQTGTGDCPAYHVGPLGVVVANVSVVDTTGFLFGYSLVAEHGHGHSDAVGPARAYVTNPLGVPDYAHKSWIGGTEDFVFPATGAPTPPDCCYEFRLSAGKRVTDGWNLPSESTVDFWTISLKFSS